jgi:predicted acylesterase/phospholipase RssA
LAETQTALALSGGGHRACLWALGVLMYLADAGRNHQVRSIASVSGGSLANAAIGQRLDYTAATAEEVRQVSGDLARLVAGRGVLFGWWGTWAYLVMLAVTGAAAMGAVVEVVAAWPLGVDAAWWLEALVAVVAALAWLRLLSARGQVTAAAFERTLLSTEGAQTLAGLHSSLDHVICATDLHAGEHVYFSSGWVCAFRFGHGSNGDLPLGRTVQASAAFPPVFGVARIDTDRFGFQSGTPEGQEAGSLALTDGGVYDNMGDQWAHGLPDRLERWGDLGFREADELIVVNSSAGLGWGSTWSFRIPVAGALLALLRMKSALYDNGTSVRRRELVRRFDLAEKTGDGLRGALVHIPQSPFRAPDAFANAGALWPERQARAQAALARLGDDPATRSQWAEVARLNAEVKTTLFGFRPEVCARLLHHVYVLAMVNLHVILAYPLWDELPAEDDFLAMATGGAP